MTRPQPDSEPYGVHGTGAQMAGRAPNQQPVVFDLNLSRALVDAAAAGIASTYAEAGTMLDPAYWRIEAERAVVAVLETLATHTGPTPADGPVRVQFLNHEEFKRLAAEVKGEQA